jgi:DNA helicase-2/ATP-dependent DNA helicase PcrA
MAIPLQFSDAAIAEMAARMTLDPPDAERLGILQAIVSCEVQAGPGSGKTTLLALKLGLLAEQWPDSGEGICVLSHTNAARHEIEGRMAKSPTLRKLLERPHFVGTIQKFVDQFLALPLLRQNGILDPQVDNIAFGAKAWSAVQQPSCSTAQSWLSRKMGREYALISGLRYADATLRVESVAGDLPGHDTATYKELKKLKDRLAKKGFFRFDDMFAVADLALVRYPYLRTALRRRFPWIFVDELQDTSDLQNKLINDLFPSPDCVVQCFGDRNQSIFDFDGELMANPGLFDQRPRLPLSSSRRFGAAIAALASPFTAVHPQVLVGFPGQADHPRTMMLFKKGNVAKVVPHFAAHVMARFPAVASDDRSICVVGRRKRAGEFKGDHFPVSLADYWAGFDPEISQTPDNPESLLSYVSAARCALARTHTGADASRTVHAGVLELVSVANGGDKNAPTSRRQLRERLTVEGTLAECQRVVWKLLDPRTVLTKPMWDIEMLALVASLTPVMPKALSDEAYDFLSWKEDAAPEAAPAEKSSENIFVYESAGRLLPIRFETVHAVKGETHTATLLVETYSKKVHDLKSLLPVLTGDTHGSQLAPGKINACMCAFVALTRPFGMVSLAMAADHVSAADIEKLQARGWTVEVLAD